MINFLKNINFKKFLSPYLLLVLSLTFMGHAFEYGNLGFNFSLPVTLTVLFIDLLIYYKKYKQWPRN